MTDQSSLHDVVMATPWPELRLGLHFADQQLAAVDFLLPDSELRPPSNRQQRKVVKQIQAYFINPATPFELELQVQGTAFQQRVWQALRKIPSGQTVSYGELARRLKSSARAVGNACRANKIPVVIPCHRVVAKSGLGGFMGQRQGAALSIKQKLLQLERGVNEGQV